LGEVVRLDVADTGIGIATEDQSRIFERFYRADTPVMEGRGGTGLGLAITKQLVELHGGRVWVKSDLGAGSTFTIILPSVAQEAPLSVPMEPSSDAKKILVVDDDRDLVALLRHRLAAEGYQVITAATGDQAIAKAIAQQPDLITLDLLLPDRHGFDVLRELKTRPEARHIPVIVLSVVRDTIGVYNLGAVDCIVKPVNERQLLDSVARVLAPSNSC
jgi:CheY-like chemotaxis protein